MKQVYFIGIGGIGMSAIARYYNHAGYSVSGYDKTPSKLTAALESEGISIHYQDQPELIPAEKEETLVIYTPAIPHDMKELVYVQENGYRLIKRSRALGEIASVCKCLAISGTHGKTTTSTMLAHILTSSGEGCNAFLGGISKNYHTNLLLSKNPVLVAEADEFDRSFLQLHPQIAVVTAMDADHLDIYSDVEHVREAFVAFGSQVSDQIIIKKGLEEYFTAEGSVSAEVLTYSYDNPSSDFYASEIEIREGGYISFTMNGPGYKIEKCMVGTPGWVNVENGVAASAVALLHGTSPEKVKEALSTFSGAERRLDIHINTPECAYIDDYAHHPNEISAAIGSIRNIFPGRKLLGIFQPHLFTRTRDFYKDFAASLSMLDGLIMLPIYPAREEPIPGITTEIILDRVTISDKKIVEKDSLLEEIRKRDTDVVITFGAGDIDRFIIPIEEMLSKKYGCSRK